MLAWRIFAVVLAAVLLAAVVVDVGIDRNREERVLLYDKGTYLGQLDTEIDDATRERVRQRTRESASGR